jgi:hypothetical protein
MFDIQTWSFMTVFLVSLGWLTLVLLAGIGSVYFRYLRSRQQHARVGVGAVSVGISVWPLLLLLFGPPVVLLISWLALRI